MWGLAVADFTTYAAALRTRLQGFTALPLYWPNDNRTPTPADAPNGFVFSEVRLTDESPASLGFNGARVHRDYGEFAVYVYVPAGTRIGTAEGYAEQIRALFKMTDVEGVIFTRRYIGPGARTESGVGLFWSVPLILQFFADRTE